MGICQSARPTNESKTEQTISQTPQQQLQTEQPVISAPAVNNPIPESTAINNIKTSSQKDNIVSSVFTFGESKPVPNLQNSLMQSKESTQTPKLGNITDSSKMKQTLEIYNKINEQPQNIIQGAGNVNTNLAGNLPKPIKPVNNIRPNVVVQPAQKQNIVTRPIVTPINTRPIVTPIKNQNEIITQQKNVIVKNQIYMGPNGYQYIVPKYYTAEGKPIDNKVENKIISYGLPQNYKVQNYNTYNKYYF